MATDGAAVAAHLGVGRRVLMTTQDGQTPLTYEFELPSRDQVRASRYVSHRQWGTWVAYLLFGGAGLFVSGASVVFELNGRYVNWVTTAPLVAVCFAMLAFVFYLPNVLVYRMRKDLPIHQGPHKWTMTQGVGLAVVSPSSSASFEWHLFKRASENSEFYFLYLTKTFALVLPKRVLGDSEAGLRQFLHAELGERANLSER